MNKFLFLGDITEAFKENTNVEICEVDGNNDYQNKYVVFVGTDIRKLRNLALITNGKILFDFIRRDVFQFFVNN